MFHEHRRQSIAGDPDMTAPASLWKIGSHWALRLGCSMETLAEPAVAVLPHNTLSRWEGAFFFCHGPSCIITVPAGLLESVRLSISDSAPSDVFSPEYSAELFGEAVDRIIGPAWLGYADATDFRGVFTGGVRALSPEDLPALRRLAESCAEEWEDSGITFKSPLVFGRFVDGELVAAGTVERSSREILNVGIITHPDHRGRGHGKSVVSAITAYGLERGAVMQYRTLESNAPSIAVARALGYQSYGSTIAVPLQGAFADDRPGTQAEGEWTGTERIMT